MSGGEEHDSFDDDDDFPIENIPSTSNETVPDGGSSRKRGTAVLTTSQSENQSCSPVKRRSANQLIDDSTIYDQNVDGFPSLADLPLSTFSSRHQHLHVISTEITDGTTTLHCKNVDKSEENTDPCIVYLQGMWHSCEIREDSTIRLIGAKKWSDTEWLVNDEDGMVVTQADTLIPCTTVVNSFFCARKAVLIERLRVGGNLASKHTTRLYSTLKENSVHDLFPIAMLAPPSVLTKEWLLSRWREINAPHLTLSLEELDSFCEMHMNWVNSYISNVSIMNQKRMEGEAMIKEVHNIEDNVWTPALGLKGKIDVSFQIHYGDLTHHPPYSHSTQRWLLPLELKTGNNFATTSHNGLALMHTMMLAHRYSLPIHEGSLLDIRDGATSIVQPRAVALKGMISRRNNLARFIGKGSTYEKLPTPRSDTLFCKTCDYASACTLYGKAYERSNVQVGQKSLFDDLPSDEAIAFQLQMTEHLTEEHLDYFRKWQRWQSLEWTESRRDKRPMSDIWEVPASKRESLSPLTTMANLKVTKCEQTGIESGKWNVTLKRIQSRSQLSSSSHCIFSKGDFVIVSTDNNPAIVLGPVTEVNKNEGTVQIVSDRILPLESGESRDEKSQVFHLDKHESDTHGNVTATVHRMQLKNLIALMKGEERCIRLRSLIIDLKMPVMMTLESADVNTVKGVVQGLECKQIGAVFKSLRASDYALIEGLPGSGKTTTLVALVRSIVALGHTVLVTAYTHSAVDNLLTKIAKEIPSSKLLRLGNHLSVQNVGLTLQAKLAQFSKPEEKDAIENEILAQTPVVAITSLAVTTHSLFSWRRFDICIIDESSLAVESSLIGPLLAADRFVLVGDAKQLKPLVQSKEASEEGMSTSLFERLITAHSMIENPNNHIVTLNKQFRMNRVVSSIASNLFYDGRLICANETVAEACLNSVHEGYEKNNRESEEGLPPAYRLALDGSIENSAVFIDVSREGKCEFNDPSSSTTVSLSTRGIVNEREVEVVKRLIEEFKARGLPTSSIGVAAVYRKQVELLRRSIPTGIEVNTVDQWQGRDAEVVICSLAWTTAHGRKRSELLSDGKRINVALTRAKYKMIFTGCVRSMRERCPLVSSVIDRVKVEKL